MRYSLLFVFIGFSVAGAAKWEYENSIFCTGRLLHDVQTSELFERQRDFLELKLLKSQEVIEHRYKILRPKIKIRDEEGRKKLKDFVRKHFQNVSILERHHPSDWNARFSLLEAVKDRNTKEILRKMNRNWLKFGRMLKKEVENYKLFSFLPLQYPFFVDKGKNEMSYEKSYWTFEALLASDMVFSAKKMLKNLFQLVEEIGHVPPESRIYFVNRCSPPILTMMLDSFYRKTGDDVFVRKNLRLAQLDFLHFLRERSQVITAAPLGTFVIINEERERLYWPRPERYLQDVSWKKELEDETFSFVFWDSKPPRSKISARTAAITEQSAIILSELTQKFGQIDDSVLYTNVSYLISKTIDRLLQNRNGWADFDPKRGQEGLTFWPALTGERSLNMSYIPTPMTAEENLITVRALLKSGNISEAREIAQKWISTVNRMKDPTLLQSSITILMINHFPDLLTDPEEKKRIEVEPIYALAPFFLVLFIVFPTIEKFVLALFL